MATRPSGSIATIAGTAAGIVVGCAVLFGVLGAVRGDSVEIADPAASESPDPVVAAPSEEPSALAGDATSEPTSDGSEAVTDPEHDPTTAASEPATEPDPEPSETVAATAVAPGDVTVQLLDATGTGDSATARKVADELKAAGYRVVVVNRASKVYEATTVFWSEGQEQAGKQIAREFGFPKAELTPDEVRLSNRVNVHVVVGTDRL